MDQRNIIHRTTSFARLERKMKTKLAINLGIEKAKLLEIEQKKHQASLWSACSMQHEAISHTLIHIREQCDASREMQEREARLAYERLLKLEGLLLSEAKRDCCGSNEMVDFPQYPGQRSPDPFEIEICSGSRKNLGLVPALPEFEQCVFEYLEANKSLTNQRIRCIFNHSFFSNILRDRTNCDVLQNAFSTTPAIPRPSRFA